MSRKSDYPILPQILNRWSSRAMSGERLDDAELMTLFEAARWAPSSYNGQPWRFIYAKREDAEWKSFMDLLIEFNQTWAKNAGALVCLISRKEFEKNGKPSRTHSFDAGAAWENLAIQGVSMGLVVHGMEGFNANKARQVLQVPDLYEVNIMFAVGKKGSADLLPLEMQKSESLTDRKDLNSLIMRGKYKSET